MSLIPRLLCFTSSLGSGGAEKHLVRVMNHLDPAEWEVHVAVARSGGSYQSELRRHVQLHSLAAPMAFAAWPLSRLTQRLRPSVLWSVMDHANCAALLAARMDFNRSSTCVSVQIPPTIEYRASWKGSLLLPTLRWMYTRADRVIALSRGVRNDLEQLQPGIGSRSEVIYNAGYDDDVLALASDVPDQAPSGTGPIIVACGRLVPQKGFSDLLRAFAIVRKEVPARLWIIGDGPLRSSLEQEAGALELKDVVWFAGARRNPYRFMRAATVFALSSHWEGFGNVIVEAMALGVPVVATDCPFGPSEIITHGESGLLVPVADPPRLAETILALLKDPMARTAIAEAARIRAQAFHGRTIAAQHAGLFRRLINGAR
jgi:glycosyltransferase involved in cell wall biosynthesis